MHKIDTSGNQNGLFVDKDPANGIPGTVVNDEWLNAVQQELVNFIINAGINLSKNDRNQLINAFKNQPIKSGLGLISLIETLKAKLIFRDNVEQLGELDSEELAIGDQVSVKGSIFRWNGSAFKPEGSVSINAYGLVNSQDGTEVATKITQMIADGIQWIELPGTSYQCDELVGVALTDHLRITSPNTQITLTNENFLTETQTYTLVTEGVFFQPRGAGVVFNGESRQHQINGHTLITNHRADDSSALDVEHFSGQGVASNIRAMVIHNYTDSSLMQMDNVGSGTILTLKNARNPTRRSDKTDSYIGTGKFLSLRSVEPDGSGGYVDSAEYFYLAKDGDFVWTGSAGTASFLQNKADDGIYGYNFGFTNDHDFMATFNGVLIIKHAASGGTPYQKLQLVSDNTKAPAGISIFAQSGAVELSSVDGRIRLPDIPEYSDNPSALSGGLAVHDLYKTPTGEVRIVI